MKITDTLNAKIQTIIHDSIHRDYLSSDEVAEAAKEIIVAVRVLIKHAKPTYPEVDRIENQLVVGLVKPEIDKYEENLLKQLEE